MNPLITLKEKLRKEHQETDRKKDPDKRVLIKQDLADLVRIEQKAASLGITFETEEQIWEALEKSMYGDAILDSYLKNLADKQRYLPGKQLELFP